MHLSTSLALLSDDAPRDISDGYIAFCWLPGIRFSGSDAAAEILGRVGQNSLAPINASAIVRRDATEGGNGLGNCSPPFPTATRFQPPWLLRMSLKLEREPCLYIPMHLLVSPPPRLVTQSDATGPDRMLLTYNGAWLYL